MIRDSVSLALRHPRPRFALSESIGWHPLDRGVSMTKPPFATDFSDSGFLVELCLRATG